MYLGVATFYQERMNEFLNVANNLEIKEVSNNVEFDNENESNKEAEISDSDNSQLTSAAQTRPHVAKTYIPIIDDSHLQKNTEDIFGCDQCQSQFTRRDNLLTHIKSKHEGVKYECNQCEYKFTQQSSLNTHIKSIHEGVKYACNQCEFKAAQKGYLNTHIRLKHL